MKLKMNITLIIVIAIVALLVNHILDTYKRSRDVIISGTNNDKIVVTAPLQSQMNLGRPLPSSSVDPRVGLYEDRIYNPLQYPYQSSQYYDDYNLYPNIDLLPSVVSGGGWRTQPTFGGSQIPIPSYLPALNISNDNIAPINIRTRGNFGIPQQVGTISKVFGKENIVLPLFGRKKFANNYDRWEYYTVLYPTGVKAYVHNINGSDYQLGTNDEVYIEGQEDKYRVSAYEHDYPQYIPYI